MVEDALAATEFRVLGPIEAVRDGTVLAVGGRRQRALLALLLLEPGRAVPADRLIDELWQGRPPSGAATSLRAYVSKLRSALGADASITRSGSGYAVAVAPDRVDAYRFEQLVKEGRAALARGAAARAAEHLRAAGGLWRGRPFDGVGEDGALRLEAERLEELRLVATEERVEADLALGGGAHLVDELEALVREHPYRERFWSQLMLALYRADRQADALAAYQRVRRLLDEELGLEPGEELQRLERAILRREVPPARPLEARHNLPAPMTSFVGREAELADVERLLGEARLVTLTGVGGAGKTRLGLEAAARAVPDYAGGVVFVDLSALAEPTLVPAQVASALDVDEGADESVVRDIAARLRDADVLLVLDNCEHLREASAQLVGTLLADCPRLRVLATSREQLGVPGEIDYAVPPLALPAPDATEDDLRGSEAVRLLLARARAARPRLADDAAALASAARICRDLDGLPLAIELAAARAKSLSLDDIAGRLADRFQFLVSWRRLTAARHRTLREAMDWSYELLAPAERALLAQLSVFAGGFTLRAVAGICVDGDDERALELLGRLVDASLVVAEERDGEMRYRLLETVRQYGAERLEEDSTAATAARRAHALFFAGLVERSDYRPHEAEVVDAVHADLENFRAAIDNAARTGEAQTELRLVGGMWRYWWNRGHLREGRAHIEDALARRGGVRGAFLARALNGGAGLALTQGDYPQAEAWAAEALAEARAGASDLQASVAHNLLGVAATRVRDYERARRHLNEFLVLGATLGRVYEITAKLNLGVAAFESGDTEAAVALFEEVLAYHREEGLVGGVGWASLNLAQGTYRLGDYERARECFREAHDAFAAIGFREHVGHSLQGLAAVEAHAENAEEAARLLGRAAAMLADVGASDDDFDPALASDAEAAAREQLGDAAFTAAFDDARRDEAVALSA